MSFFKRERNSVDEFREGLKSLKTSATALRGDEVASDTDYPMVEERAPAPVDPLDKYRHNSTMVAKDSAFNGTLKSNSNLCIEGNFEGELEARDTIFVAHGASVKATMRATDVIIAGTLDGTVDAAGRFHAMPSARVSGEIKTGMLVVDQGSDVNCRFAMQPRKEKVSA